MKNITFKKNEIIKRLYKLDSVSNYRLHSIAQRIRKKTLNKLFMNPPVIDEKIKSNLEMFNKIMGARIDNIIDFLNFNFSNYFKDKKYY